MVEESIMMQTAQSPSLAEENLYRPLDPKQYEIRLLTLLPGDFEAPLAATLSVVSLLEEPSFEAISYVWGSPTEKRTIQLNDIRAEIMVNLADALQRMRLKDAPRVLWADAVCIDQMNHTERARQVALMSVLYHQASYTLIWLGRSDDESEKAIVSLRSLSTGDHLPLRNGCQRNETSGDCSSEMAALIRLFRRPWWYRTWVVQEAGMARRTIVYCGGDVIEDRIWIDAARHALSHLHQELCCSLEKLCSACRVGLHLIIHKIANMIEPYLPGNTDLLELATMYRAQQATDPRDKIYGLLGLATNAQINQTGVNYTLSAETLYQKVVINDIIHRATLRSLILVEDNKDTHLSMPSWVPDWTSPPSFTGVAISWLARYNCYSTSRNVPVKDVTITANGNLSISGFRIDKIVSIGEPTPLQDDDQVISPAAILRWKEMVYGQQNSDSKYIGGGTWSSAFWRTVIADTIAENLLSNHDNGDKTHKYIRLNGTEQEVFWAALSIMRESYDEIPDLSDPDIFSEFFGRIKIVLLCIRTATSGRNFFITEKGYVGNGPFKTEVGDEIFVLCGGKYPFLLRRKPVNRMAGDDGEDIKATHTLVGHCYVHGIMDGEVAENFEERATRVNIG